MRSARDIRREVDEALSPEGQMETVLLMPDPDWLNDARGAAGVHLRGKQNQQWLGVPLMFVPTGVPPDVPVTHTVDTAEGLLRLPTHSRVPSMKQVLLFLTTCEYCGEATTNAHSSCCQSCDYIYGPVQYDDDEINP